MTCRPECWLCGYTADETELRQQHDGYWSEPAQYTCEECFRPDDTGPCFDDLPLAEVA